MVGVPARRAPAGGLTAEYHPADLFLRDRRTGRAIRVDRTSAGGQANRGVGRVAEDIRVAMTPGARWVAFVSPSTNLASPASPRAHVYRRGPLC